MKYYILFFFSLLFILNTKGQEISAQKIISITGKVIDKDTSEPLQYATITFLKAGQNKIIGTATDAQGSFEIKVTTGIYTIKVDFLSFESHELKIKELIDDLDLGTIGLKIESNNLNEVEIIAEKKLLEFKINKKIYNASADIANKGGNGLDILNNTPSVRVDVDGNISVRGSAATILIDGKPQFNLDNNTDILKAMPSNSIDKVEIISRSAKYSAEGGGVILNIITKKKKESDFKASFEAHAGTTDHGFSTFLNENTGKMNLYSTISFNREDKAKTVILEQPLLNLFEKGIEDRLRNSFLFNLGSDFYLDDKNTITTSFLMNTNNKNYNNKIVATNFDRNTTNIDNLSKLEAQLGYTRKFKAEGHKVAFNFRYENTASDAKDDILELQSAPVTTIIQQAVKDQQLDIFSTNVDYTLPFNENTNLELGYNGAFKDYNNTFRASEFDEGSNIFITIGDFDDTLNYTENINAFYGVYNATHNKFSYAVGLRAEISSVIIALEKENNPNTKNYTDLFPSLTLAYEINDDSFLSFNYSKAIDRPTIPQINPLLSFSDQRFQTVGNPDLNPFYTDYFEVMFDQSFEKVTLMSAFFINNAKNQFLSVIENTGQFTTNGDEIFTRTFINSGNSNILGLDLDITYRPFKGLRLNAYVSPYHKKISNALNSDYNNSNTVWLAQGSALISLNSGFRFMLSNQYNSSIKTGLTTLKAVNLTNVTISKRLFKNNGTLTFKAIDIFKTKRFIYESLEANTETLLDIYYQNQYSLSFTYRIKQKRKSSKDRSKDVDKDELEDKQDEEM